MRMEVLHRTNTFKKVKITDSCKFIMIKLIRT